MLLRRGVIALRPKTSDPTTCKFVMPLTLFQLVGSIMTVLYMVSSLNMKLLEPANSLLYGRAATGIDS